jgi:predicted RNA-binding protein with PUA-like domain
MANWLLKSEPTVYSFDQFLADGTTYWDGVRNYQARKNLRAMKKGDTAFFYHSNEDRQVVGTAEVTREAYPDPTDDTDEWVVVDIKPLKRLVSPVSLHQFKMDSVLKHSALVRQSRLSVMPLDPAQAKRITELASA